MFYAVIGTRSPSPHAAEKCRQICRKLASEGHSLITGNAVGIDSIARDIWNETAPDKVTLVLPWPGYNKDRIHRANKVIVYAGQPEWTASVDRYHPAPDRLTPVVRKLHARNYGIIVNADVVIAFPSSRGGGTAQGIRIAKALRKELYVYGP